MRCSALADRQIGWAVCLLERHMHMHMLSEACEACERERV